MQRAIVNAKSIVGKWKNIGMVALCFEATCCRRYQQSKRCSNSDMRDDVTAETDALSDGSERGLNTYADFRTCCPHIRRI